MLGLTFGIDPSISVDKFIINMYMCICNKCITAIEDVNNEGSMQGNGLGAHGKSQFLPVNFTVCVKSFF